jgi:hypothetical protein
MTIPKRQAAEELIVLCDLMLDGALSKEEAANLESMVLADPAIRELYVEYLQLNAHLIQHGALLADGPMETLVTVSRSQVANDIDTSKLFSNSKNQAWWLGTHWQVASSFVLGLGVAAASWLFVNRSESVAVLTQVENVTWETSTLPTEPGALLSRGRFRLVEGLAKIRFQSGAEITLEGPADLELVGRKSCRLHHGALIAHVPESAKGFTVQTSSATLIDHGTDFGIRSDTTGRANVHVMKGEVELKHVSGGPSVRLITKQTAVVTPDRLLPTEGSESEPNSLLQQESASDFKYELTTRIGRGAAAYVVSPGTSNHFSDTLLLLKNSHEKSFLRKAILRFDLRGCPDLQSSQVARLTLQFDPTGYGYAALGGEAKMVVYALIDDTEDEWSPEGLAWKSLPAYHPDAGRVDESKATKIGEFTIPRGVLRGAFSVESTALLTQLKQDSNGLLTLIVVRENPLDEGSGVVHGFAGNRHPTLAPPTLRIR